MKELSIEQKAKAYDKVIERATKHRNNDGLTLEQYETIDIILPELTESEDEKVRKAIINVFASHKNYENFYGVSVEDIIAWLEAQGKQKPVQEIEPTPIFKIGDILKRKGKDYTFRVDRIQGGYYHCDRNYGAFFPIEEQGNWELVEQKPWSEEDEKKQNYLIALLQNSTMNNHDLRSVNEGLEEWLKSLKDRVQPQPKQEWNEEDDIYISDVLWCVEQAKKVAKDENDMGTTWCAERWLKSLRPQNRWKPSDAQMASITCAVRKMKESACYDSELVSLLNDLKKL